MEGCVREGNVSVGGMQRYMARRDIWHVRDVWWMVKDEKKKGRRREEYVSWNGGNSERWRG